MAGQLPDMCSALLVPRPVEEAETRRARRMSKKPAFKGFSNNSNQISMTSSTLRLNSLHLTRGFHKVYLQGLNTMQTRTCGKQLDCSISEGPVP
jgi:hypothetical protein